MLIINLISWRKCCCWCFSFLDQSLAMNLINRWQWTWSIAGDELDQSLAMNMIDCWQWTWLITGDEQKHTAVAFTAAGWHEHRHETGEVQWASCAFLNQCNTEYSGEQMSFLSAFAGSDDMPSIKILGGADFHNLYIMGGVCPLVLSLNPAPCGGRHRPVSGPKWHPAYWTTCSLWAFIFH